jgi:uncharacterized protein YdhG (YjbR/CyaY superfamily)
MALKTAKKRPASAPPTSVDDYLAAAPPDKRAALTRLRRTISATAPGAIESISYGIAAFKLDGKPLAYYSYWRDHCSVYGFGKALIAAHAAELKPYSVTSGTIRFSPGKPLPDRLVRALVRGRMAEIERSAR